MAEYYSGVCKSCGNDCDGIFCCSQCADEWNEGYADYLHDVEKDRQLDEELCSEHAHELINR